MFRITRGSAQNLADAEKFVEMLGRLDEQPQAEVRELFDRESDVFVARAPGRLDVMGGIADYSGSLVLQLPVAEAALCAVQTCAERKITVVSLATTCDDRRIYDASRVKGRTVCFEMRLEDFERDGKPIDYSAAQKFFKRDAESAWAAYAAGAFLVLMRERGARFGRGARILINSAVPEGKGVSSSAALEVAAMTAIAAAFDLQVEPRDAALLCQTVENAVVGAPCGVMDQMTAACGEAGKLLALVCQPAELLPPLVVPANVGLWGIDSGIRHSVGGGDYGTVRAAAFMGFRIIADLAGLRAEPTNAENVLKIADSRWNNFLANVAQEEYEREFEPFLPETIGGSEFLKRYGGTIDAVTKIEPDVIYPLKAATAHPIYEHARVRRFAQILREIGDGEASESQLSALGALMFASHQSYSACGLGSEGTDEIVEAVRRAGAPRGLFGAKITGGGSGGTVAVLGDAAASESVGLMAARYRETTGYEPLIFSRSSPGAGVFGHLRLTPES